MDKQEEILELLKGIKIRLDKIEEIINLNQKSAKKMDDHIDFVDNVYESIKKPFCNILSYYNGKNINIDKNLLKNNEE